MILRWKPSNWQSPRNWPSYRVHLAPVRSYFWKDGFHGFASEKRVSIFSSVSSICSGKTYVGLKIAQALLANQELREDNTPMLVVCYTNHALDQFLEGKPNGLTSSSDQGLFKTFVFKSEGEKSQTLLPDMNFISLWM